MRFLIYLSIAVILSACAKVEEQIITISTIPPGADITISENNSKTGDVTIKNIGISPIDFIIIPEVTYGNSAEFDDTYGPDGNNDFSNGGRQNIRLVKEPKYIVSAKKDGYFSEDTSLDNYDEILKTKTLIVKLYKSPMWWATADSVAINQWINLIVSPEISNDDMWQRVVDAVTKRYSDLDNYDFKSGYLTTLTKTKTYKTRRGTFLLRSKFTATIMEKNPLTYRLKLESEWSTGDGITWYQYPRVFTEDAELITELMSRFQAY